MPLDVQRRPLGDDGPQITVRHSPVGAVLEVQQRDVHERTVDLEPHIKVKR
jgi:hypothetical protein